MARLSKGAPPRLHECAGELLDGRDGRGSTWKPRARGTRAAHKQAKPLLLDRSQARLTRLEPDLTPAPAQKEDRPADAAAFEQWLSVRCPARVRQSPWPGHASCVPAVPLPAVPARGGQEKAQPSSYLTERPGLASVAAASAHASATERSFPSSLGLGKGKAVLGAHLHHLRCLLHRFISRVSAWGDALLACVTSG